jgi:hypothetical protein
MPPAGQLSEQSPGIRFIFRFSDQAAIQHYDRIGADDKSGFALACNGNNFSPRNACDIIGRCFIRMRPLLDLAGQKLELNPDLPEQLGAPGGRGS